MIIRITDVYVAYQKKRVNNETPRRRDYVPDESTATLEGEDNDEDVATLSPLKPAFVLLPAIVDIMPVDTVTLRIRLLSVSTTYTLPDASSATPYGLVKVADVAASPSPLKLLAPVPAIVVIMKFVLGLRLGKKVGGKLGLILGGKAVREMCVYISIESTLDWALFQP